MSAAGWFVAGWISAAVFIAAGLWLRDRWVRTQEALSFEPTSCFLQEHSGAPVYTQRELHRAYERQAHSTRHHSV